MARDPDALKISKWAATGDVEDPEDGGIDRSIGWDISHSQPGGSLPKREHFNELHREETALGAEINAHGLLEWDSSISYEHPAMVMGSDARPYVSVQNSAGVDPTSDIIDSHWALLESHQFDITANREAAGNKGVLFYSTDDDLLQYDDGAAWQTIVRRLNIPVIIGDGVGVITTGEKGHIQIPQAATIIGVTMLADQSGSIVVDIFKDTYANFPPTVADTITASAKPTISSAVKSQDRTLTGWATAIAKEDILAFNVDSITSIKRVTLSLGVTIS